MVSLSDAAEAIRHTLQTIYENPSGHHSLDINLPLHQNALAEYNQDPSPSVSLSDIINALSRALDVVSHYEKDHLASLYSDDNILFIEKLRHCKSLIQIYSSRRHPSSTSIYDLPPELLSCIFEESVSFAPGTYPATALRIASVCRSWRENALSHPRLWSTIAITTQAQSYSVIYGREEVLRLYLHRSRSEPLTIIFRGKRSTLDLQRRPKKSDKPDWSWAQSFVPILRAHEARWQRIRLSRMLCKNEDIEMLFAPVEGALPNFSELQNLTIPSLDRMPLWNYPAFLNAPKLTSLAFDDPKETQFPSVADSQHFRAQITALRIDRCLGIECLFTAMTAFPNIRDLMVYIDRPRRCGNLGRLRILSRVTVLWVGHPPQIMAPTSNLVSRLTWNLSGSSFIEKPFQGLRFKNLDTLHMIYHPEFDDEEDNNDAVIGIGPILDVVCYSASRLQHITFAAIPISGMDIIRILQDLPQLGSLIIHDPNPNDFELPDTPPHRLLCPIDEHLLYQLTAPPSGLPFLPCLKSIELVWTQDIDETTVMDMIESRRGCDTPLQRATLGKLERHINLAPATHQRLRSLRKGGLEFLEEWNSI
ncbi:uncharacterized protein EV420DRAFT_513807 [Desarmillaria tabescens]|uniref:F-box domain-containing protein n=1 Tax=Armillaria tabescens TaxID=1929756 RepID=A0AA39KEB0_ARMTA|nr:uncharacterized protein EV420DRAFT_513807 [Desarmillaria tabescens]KAK0457228.1 hypothetical protein EV420DRAFT_513807 [Desarmillaria tabescens]